MSYLRGPKSLSTPVPPTSRARLCRAAQGEPRAPRASGNAGHPPATRVGNCACATKARAPPFAFKSGGGKGHSVPPKGAPWLRRDAVLLEPSNPHVHSPAPRRSSGPQGASGPQARGATFPATELSGTRLRPRACGAGRAGLAHVTRAGRGIDDKLRKREASISIVLSESIPYVEPKITAQRIFY